MSATSISRSGMPAIGASASEVFGTGLRRSRKYGATAQLGPHRSTLMVTIGLVTLAVAAAVLWVSVGGSSIVAAEARVGGDVQVLQADGSDGARVMSRSNPALIEHVVVPGDTLWALAVSVGGDADPRAYIDRVQRLNGLSTVALQVGRVVLLPSGG